MIDIFALALSHGLMFLGLWRMAFSPELDGEEAAPRAGKPRPDHHDA